MDLLFNHIKPYLFSNILYDTSEAEILMNFKKQLDVDYYKIKELIEKDDYETIYKSINVLFTSFISITYYNKIETKVKNKKFS